MCASSSKSKIGIRSLTAKASGWVIALVGSIAVTVLLMIFAGVFAPKVGEPLEQSSGGVLPDRETAEVRKIRQPRYETAVGSIEPIHQSSVAAKILARVMEVNVSAGQEVKAGDVLVRLNDDDLQSRLKQAEASLVAASARWEQAQADYNRARQLIENNAVSKAEFEAASTGLRASQASMERAERAVEEARVVLDYATIEAPFDGIVVDKQVQAGDTVTPGQPMLTLYDPTQMQLVANVRESLAMDLKVGQQVSASLETFDYECEATIREVVPQAEAGSRSFQVKVSGPCPPGVYSGMFGRLKLPLEDEELTVIPASAVERVGQLTLVDVVDGDAIRRRNVQLGRRLDDQVEVLSGLKPGEIVVVQASQEGAS